MISCFILGNDADDGHYWPLLRIANLLRYFGDTARADRPAPFPNVKPLAAFHGHGSDQVHVHRYVIAWHYHFHSLRQGDISGHVAGAEIELRTILVEKRGVP